MLRARAIKYYNGWKQEKMRRRPENNKKMYSAICMTKMDYGSQLYNTASPERLNKLDGMPIKVIRI